MKRKFIFTICWILLFFPTILSAKMIVIESGGENNEIQILDSSQISVRIYKFLGTKVILSGSDYPMDFTCESIPETQYKKTGEELAKYLNKQKSYVNMLALMTKIGLKGCEKQ